jgi:hypothetical protein
MAKLAGHFTTVLVGGYDLSGYANQFEAVKEYDELDGSAFIDTGENSFAGLAKGTLTVQALLDGAANTSYAALNAPGGYTAKVLSILLGQNAAPTIGDPALCLYALQFSFTTPLAARNAVLANISASSAGGELVDFGALIQAYTTITTTTNFTSIDNSASSSNGGTGYLHVVTPTTTDTYAVKLQHSTDNNSWADLSPAFTANGQTRTSERIEISGTINRYVRAVATRTGAAGNSFKLAVLFIRN